MSERTDQEILDELARLKDQIPQDTTIEDLISKAKEEEMTTKQKVKDNETRTQVGSWIDRELWKQIKAQAALEGRGAGYVMDDAIKMYIKAQKENKQNG